MHPDLRLETWAEEIRQVTVLFVNIGLEEADSLAAARYDDAVRRIQDIFTSIQKCIYQYEGSLNKFLKDDKGFTLIAIFGLAPIQHVDDGCRGMFEPWCLSISIISLFHVSIMSLKSQSSVFTFSRLRHRPTRTP